MANEGIRARLGESKLTRGSLVIAVEQWLQTIAVDYAKMGEVSRHKEAEIYVDEFLAALSSPCAICGGKEPIPGWVRPEIFDGAVGRGIPAGFSIMLQPDDVYTKPISFIVLPTKEGVPAFRQGFTDGSSLLLEEPDFPGVPGAWEEERP